MKTYFALPLGENEILFVKDEKKCRDYAFELLKGHFENPKEIVEVQPYWQRFCMEEVLKAVNTPDSRVEMLSVDVDENSADALRQTLIDFCKTVPVQRKPFTLRLVAPPHTDEKLLEKLIKPFNYDRQRKKKSFEASHQCSQNQEDGRTGFTVHFASGKIADEKTVKDIANAVSKLNDPKNERFVVPMYKDNLFLFVDKDGWARKEQMAKNDAFEYKGELKGNKLQELLFLMSLPTSKAKTLALKDLLEDFRLNEDELKLILNHGNRTGWSLTGCYIYSSVKGKSMCCLSINDKPHYAQHFLDKKTFQKEILEVFKQEKAKSLAKRTCDLEDIFNYKASYWAEYSRGFVSLADALKIAEQLEGDYQPLELKQNFDFMNRREKKKAAEFMTWITEGLKAICNDEKPVKRCWCLSLENLSRKQRNQITTLKLDEAAKRKLVFDEDGGMLYVRAKIPFKAEPSKEGVLTIRDSDFVMSDFAKKINNKIRDDSLPYKVEGEIDKGEGTGVLILKDLRLPALTAKTAELIFSFEKGSREKKQVQQLVIGDALKTWFENNKGNQHALEDFTEVLAEQPQIQCVDLSRLKDDKDVHNCMRI